jgi:hypothetical protein
MGSKLHFSFLVCLLSFAIAALLACEDNPEECYSDEDCGEGYTCEPTYYTTGSRSGGVCRKIETETEADGGEIDASGGADDAAVQDSSQASSVVEASTEAAMGVDAAADGQTAVIGDAASDAPETNAEAAVEGGQPPQPADGGNVDSAI